MKRILTLIFALISLSSSAQVIYTFVARDSNSVTFNGKVFFRNYGVAYGSSTIYVREITTGLNLTQAKTPQSYSINGRVYSTVDSCGKALLKIVTPYGAAGQVLWSDTVSTIATQSDLRSYWHIGGNAISNSATQWLGTSNSQDLSLRANGTEQIKLFANNNIQIGNGTLANGSPAFMLYGDISSVLGDQGILQAAASPTFNNVAAGGVGYFPSLVGGEVHLPNVPMWAMTADDSSGAIALVLANPYGVAFQNTYADNSGSRFSARHDSAFIESEMPYSGLKNKIMATKRGIDFSAKSVLALSIDTFGQVVHVLIPTYANDAAADADATLPSKSEYLLTGNRTLFIKP